MTNRRSCRAILVLPMALGLTGCHEVPPPLVKYANDVLPKRNAGAYQAVVPELRSVLVLQDATAACSVAVANGEEEADAPACKCANSSEADWEANCAGWFGG